jgi:hypothetical protein
MLATTGLNQGKGVRTLEAKSWWSIVVVVVVVNDREGRCCGDERIIALSINHGILFRLVSMLHINTERNSWV